MNKLTLTRQGDTHVLITRGFAAPPEAVYRAHTECALLQQWLLGPAGWTMPACLCEPRVGGRFRYDWAHDQRAGFYVTGEFLEIEPFRRIVHVERMHLPEPTPDNHVETRFDPDGHGTLMTLRMSVPDAATREQMLATGMQHGMEASYARLDRMS
jgi:uncharacterized protein YndB with AHSA1/START domain